jgi:hypothetical protein
MGSGVARGSLPDNVYDYATRERREEYRKDGKRDQGWIKNRYSYCQGYMVYIGAIECGLFPPSCRLAGEYDVGTRATEAGVRLVAPPAETRGARATPA